MQSGAGSASIQEVNQLLSRQTKRAEATWPLRRAVLFIAIASTLLWVLIIVAIRLL